MHIFLQMCSVSWDFPKCKMNDQFPYLKPVANIPFLCENTTMKPKHSDKTLSFYGNVMKRGSKCYFRAFFSFLFRWLAQSISQYF